MHIGPPEFPFPSSSTTFLSHSQLMLNRFYTQMATIVHCLTQARTERETRDKWVRGDADFTSQCASRTAGREAGALGAEFTWGGWGPGAEWETCEKKTPIQGTSHWTTLLDSHFTNSTVETGQPCPPLQWSFCDKPVSKAMNKISPPEMECCKENAWYRVQ